MVQGSTPEIDFKSVQRAGFPVVVWTVNDPARMRVLLQKRIDGIISDRPDLLRRERDVTRQTDRSYAERFDAEGHRGGRDLRPENTLPAFESGLDHMITTIETDIGVTRDQVSLISHEQFINPQTCRRVDGEAYTSANQVWIKDIDMAMAARTYICDKTFRGSQQKNELELSPAAVAFASQEGLVSPYSPTNVLQLFKFVKFYVDFYRIGPGKTQPFASERAANGERVRFNLETKLTPESERQSHTFGHEVFAGVLGETVASADMPARCDIQSFDFRTLRLVQGNFPTIRTIYLLESLAALDQQ